MAFEWKNSKDIFKGPGIYHLTFAVAGRRPLLGELVALEHSRAYSRAGSLSRSYLGGVERPLHIDENAPRQASQQNSRQGRFTSQLATTELSLRGRQRRKG